MLKPLILIGAEDIDFYMLLGHVLQVEGFDTDLASDIKQTVKIAVERNPHSIVLDCRPASFPAAETCARLKQDDRTKAIPVIALIGQGAEKEHIELLKSGVDDAITRPFSPATLVDHIRPDRGEGPSARNGLNGPLLTYADVELDPRGHRVRRGGRDIHLSPIEFRMLRHLLQNPEQAFTRNDLIGAAWQQNVYVGPRTVDVHVGILRRALKTGSESDLIRTIRSVGYGLARPDEEVAGTDMAKAAEDGAATEARVDGANGSSRQE